MELITPDRSSCVLGLQYNESWEYPGYKTTAVHPENSFAATLKPQ